MIPTIFSNQNKLSKTRFSSCLHATVNQKKVRTIKNVTGTGLVKLKKPKIEMKPVAMFGGQVIRGGAGAPRGHRRARTSVQWPRVQLHTLMMLPLLHGIK